MFVVFILLWCIGAIVLKTDYKSRVNRWLTCLGIFCGFGGFSVFLEESILPHVKDLRSEYILNWVIGLSAAIAHYLAPYCLLIFCLFYSGKAEGKPKWVVNLSILILSIPAVFMFVKYPLQPQFNPSYVALTLWVTPYVVAANWILYKSYSKEKNVRAKRKRMISCIAITPTTITTLITSYIFIAMDFPKIWQYDVLIIGFQFVIFIYLAFRDGVLGIAIKFEKDSMDNTMKALDSGIAILNHTLKNEILKISMSNDNIKSYCDLSNDSINESYQVINESTSHMMAMVNRIQEQVKEIVLKKKQNNLVDIIESSLKMVSPYIQSKNIEVTRNYKPEIIVPVMSDDVHVKECLNNLLKNSIEAIGERGKLNVGIFKGKKYIVVSVKDNGIGISRENLTKVLQPFFSTKNKSSNFGLGLSYCYNVMQKHDGTMDIQSELNVGTNILLYFPVKQSNVEYSLPEMGGKYEFNKSCAC